MVELGQETRPLRIQPLEQVKAHVDGESERPGRDLERRVERGGRGAGSCQISGVTGR